MCGYEKRLTSWHVLEICFKKAICYIVKFCFCPISAFFYKMAQGAIKLAKLVV